MGKSKGSSQPEAERLVIEEVKERWVHGNPVTRLEIYNLLRANYETSILSTSCTWLRTSVRQCDIPTEVLSLCVMGANHVEFECDKAPKVLSFSVIWLKFLWKNALSLSVIGGISDSVLSVE